MSRTARLCAVSYELGEYAEPVTELPELTADTELSDRLTAAAAGFDTYYWSDATVTELMANSAQRTLLAAEVSAADVDLVVLATDSLPRNRTAHRVVAGLLAELGLKRATALTVGLMDCATAMMAVGTAASYVRDGSARHVLVLSGDVAMDATAGDRVVADGAAIASDAAASALVTTERPGLPVLSTAHHTAGELLEDLPPQRRLALRVSGHRELLARLTASQNISPSKMANVFASNLSRNVQRLYLAELGFTDEQIMLDNVGRLAHCLGSDPLISLADHYANSLDACHGVSMLLGAGVTHLGAVLLGPWQG